MVTWRGVGVVVGEGGVGWDGVKKGGAGQPSKLSAAYIGFGRSRSNHYSIFGNHFGFSFGARNLATNPVENGDAQLLWCSFSGPEFVAGFWA
jgi:hypothetical protein